MQRILARRRRRGWGSSLQKKDRNLADYNTLIKYYTTESGGGGGGGFNSVGDWIILLRASQKASFSILFFYFLPRTSET